MAQVQGFPTVSYSLSQAVQDDSAMTQLFRHLAALQRNCVTVKENYMGAQDHYPSNNQPPRKL